jgi:hypothetical protein
VEAAGPGLLSVRQVTPEQVGEFAARDGIVLHELVGVDQSSLEEVFLEMTSDESPDAQEPDEQGPE